jgi:hypothetical protein
MKGIFEFEVGEPKVKRGFKFGTYALAIAQEKEKCSLSELFYRLGVTSDEIVGNVSVLALLHVFYGAAVHYATANKQPADFTTHEVSEWLDELGFVQTETMLKEGLSTYTPKNLNSPTEIGEKISA